MAKQPQSQDASRWLTHAMMRLREGLLILILSVSLFLLLSLLTYHEADSGWSRVGAQVTTQNAAGPAGAWFAEIFFYLLGYFAYGLPLLIAYYGIVRLAWLSESEFDTTLLAFRFFGLSMMAIAGCGLLYLHIPDGLQRLPNGPGGVLGMVVGQILLQYFNPIGGSLILVGCLLMATTLATGLSWLVLARASMRVMLASASYLARYGVMAWRTLCTAKKREREIPTVSAPHKSQALPPVSSDVEPVERPSQNKLKQALKHASEPVKKIKLSKRAEKERQLKLFSGAEGELPSFQLLEDADNSSQSELTQEILLATSQQVESKLADFGVEVKVVAVHPGPVITRFELQLAPGVKASKVSGLAKDLARSLSVVSVRVVEIIPGKPVVGLELPNPRRLVVRLREILSSDAYEALNSPLCLALGKDIAGLPVVVDLSKMPHLLVAGTTGSGKSVGINAMLLSMLYKAQPSDVRMIMIDPKMLELNVYEGIPHLLAPVVTDMKEAANALKWCVAEMERRYQLMSALSVRNITGFNKKIQEAEKEGESIVDPLHESSSDTDEAPVLEPMPYIVVIVDEFADMIMVVGKKVEELIARIAQKARAAGIHLILATQRPSVDVITGLIKANVPTRIAFQVASRIDSRTILDQQGAEQLLGKGDMLYLPVGAGIPVRVHGAFVADSEVLRVVGDWKKRGKPDYHDEILSGISASQLGGNFNFSDEDGDSVDPLYDEAVMIVTETRRASISMVQRRLKIGYNRAARLVEEMESQGVVSAMQTNGTREVLAPPPPPKGV